MPNLHLSPYVPPTKERGVLIKPTEIASHGVILVPSYSFFLQQLFYRAYTKAFSPLGRLYRNPKYVRPHDTDYENFPKIDSFDWQIYLKGGEVLDYKSDSTEELELDTQIVDKIFVILCVFDGKQVKEVRISTDIFLVEKTKSVILAEGVGISRKEEYLELMMDSFFEPVKEYNIYGELVESRYTQQQKCRRIFNAQLCTLLGHGDENLLSEIKEVVNRDLLPIINEDRKVQIIIEHGKLTKVEVAAR